MLAERHNAHEGRDHAPFMRIIAFLAAILLAPALAGCVDNDSNPVNAFELDTIKVPAGATLHEDGAGAYLKWLEVDLPFTYEFELPAGVTRVSLVAKGADDDAFRPYLYHEDTGRRRCNTDVVAAWNLAPLGQNQCSGLTAMDRPGTVWAARVTGPSLAGEVHLHFDTRPVDGIAGTLDLDTLSQADFEPGEFWWERVPSFDGTELHVEVSLPDGEGPWPVVISSSPYNHPLGAVERPERAMWAYFAHDWTTRGYAVINADVRGYGESDGCVTVWGEEEQLDQVALVEWAAQQDWSDGNVGFYGQSYLGTTAVEAAVYAPEALKAIIAVAPVIRNYDDWHHGGVPNGESSLSPVAYQVLTGMTSNVYVTPGEGGEGPDYTVMHAAGGLCDGPMAAEANDPRHIYTDFYAERDFAARAGDITAAVLYTQGFEDSNVKSTMIPAFFNDVAAPKLGLFGHFVHQHPTRADQEVLFLAWLDHYLKGIDNGVDALPQVDVVLEDGVHRTASAWPTPGTTEVVLYPDFAAGAWGDEPTSSDAALLLRPAANPTIVPSPLADAVLAWTPDRDTPVTGRVQVPMTFHIEGSSNVFLFARLYLGDELLSYGGLNAAHNEDHTGYAPVTGVVDRVLEFLPTEFIVPAGQTLRVEITSAAAGDEALGIPGHATGRVVLHGTEDGDGVRLVLPTLPVDAYEPTPASAAP